MSTERQREQEYDDASRASLDESGEDAGTVPGRSGSGSAHPEPNPTGNVGLSDYSVSEDSDRG
ncbi:hypothetical protein [Lentzea flava]|uniref:Uncharacterized protein n=1 Tax=Lentzea flava TaxID=103732 RepID=A0ABQ2UDR1_9PSEU|nr:hypothetical protein [Lentzea flava]MCP2196529.1 hypothetical protein [Lentzea flava]GGU17326.1 hypothetical protein GCM10010178_06450 [Lentzea flava]